ncbi:hypothetical protein Tco_1216755 [Tanacetum coccineum]
MHNIIMAVGSRDHPPMLAIGQYAQWRSPVPATDNSPAVLEQTTIETILNMSPKNKAHFESEKEAIHLILTGIGDEIYSTVDACLTAYEMWEAIERLQQGESLNIQDVKTNLFWEFGKFTSHDGESIESYYCRVYKLMNEMIRNNLTIDTMQVNVQFLQQLQQEWSGFEVNEIRVEQIAKNANPLALVATAQPHQDPYYQTLKSHKSYAPTSKASLPTRSHATTRHKVKEIAKPITPPSESASEEDSDPEKAQKDKEINKNVDTTSRYKNDNQTGQFRNQRIMTVVGARETIGSPVVKQSGIQCFNCKEFGHFAKGLKTSRITRKRCCYANKLRKVQYDTGYNVFANEIQLSEQSESISNTCVVETDDRNVIPDSPDMCDNDIQNDQNDVECNDERVALANLIANLKLDVDENKKIQKQLKKANTTLAHELTECKSILAETSITLEESNRLLAQKDIDIKEGLKLKAYKISVVKEKHDELVKQSLLTKSHYEGLVKDITKVITDLKLKEEKDIDKMISMEKELKFLNEIVYKRSQSIQTIHMLEPKCPTFNGRPTFANPISLKKAQSEHWYKNWISSRMLFFERPHNQIFM